MGKLIKVFAFRTVLIAIFSTFVLSISVAQEVGAADELRDIDSQKARVGIVAVGWEQFADINQRKFDDGSHIKLYDVSEWGLSETWTIKITENLAPESFRSIKLSDIDMNAMLAAYENDLNLESKDWATLLPHLQEVSATYDLDNIVVFAPTENTISATTMFGETRTDFPGGVGIMRYNRSASFCYVAGTLYLFDREAGRIQNQTKLQEDFGFMKPSAFFFQLTKELRQAMFADYSDEQKAFLRQQVESSFDKHFHNSVSRLMQPK